MSNSRKANKKHQVEPPHKQIIKIGSDQQGASAPSLDPDHANERTQLRKEGVEISARFDRCIISLPSGALVLSLGFLEKFAPHPTPNTYYLIALAWGALVVSLLAGLISLHTAMLSNSKEIKNLDDQYSSIATNPQASTSANISTNVTIWLNWIALITFVIGAISLCVFAFKNLPKARDSENLSAVNARETIKPLIALSGMTNFPQPPIDSTGITIPE